ncbi:FecR domain-containing protein [Olivibacter sp. CPCC 100613]|uniref:FecR domain-containing protein n=1 Tax=Olivibacter sp. CPCC 100613 TaxID=3079931 RepID=UPI002FFC3EC7
MTNKPFHIASEISRYLLGKLNAEEEHRLLEKLEKDAELQAIIARYKDNKEVLKRLRYMQHHHLNMAWMKVEAKRMTKVKRLNLHARRWWIGIAASILFTVSVFLVMQNKKDPGVIPINASHYKNDVLPGTYRATLTLSTGKIIALEDRNINLKEKDGTALGGSAGIISYQNNDLKNDQEAFYNTIEVPKAGTYQVVLPDGSRVWLNARSSLTFPTRFSGTSRDVTLTGEAYFEVMTDPEKPFKVQVNGSQITVLGTSFNVNAYRQRLETSLISGKVRIAFKEVEEELKPGEKAVIKQGKIAVQPADLEKVIAWKNGYFHFENDNISLVLEELARWYDIDVKYVGIIQGSTFTGSIPRSVNLSEALDIIADVSDMRFLIDGRIISAQSLQQLK